MSRRRAAVAILLALTLALLSSTGEARGRKVTCESYERATGTVVTDCRAQDEKPTHCESYTNINGTTKTECR